MDKLINLPDLLGFRIGNPLGLTPLAMLIVIAVVVAVMSVFNYQIRYRDGGRFYPVLYCLFGLSLLATFYYVFQAGLPAVDGVPCIGWFCRPEHAGGMAWVILAIVLTLFVSLELMNATMQVVAQLSVEAGMSLEEKRWKEWKWLLYIVLIGVSVSGVGYAINHTFAGWALAITAVATVAFVVFKVVRDTLYCGKFLPALLIGVVALLGSAASMVLFLELIHAYFYLTFFLVAFLSTAKARKKKPAKN